MNAYKINKSVVTPHTPTTHKVPTPLFMKAIEITTNLAGGQMEL